MNCEFVNVTARDGVDLQGLMFTSNGASPSTSSGQTPTTVGVWVHGLTASFHSNYKRHTILAKIFNEKGIAYATFDTRGHDVVTFNKKWDKRKRKGYRSITVGGAYEKFPDCVLDLDGIVDFLRERFENIILIGHSTGANKVVYYLSQRGKQKKISGVVLASPVSDVSLYKRDLGKKYEKALEVARAMARKGRGGELMPQELTRDLRTASRFLSLSDQNSVEQMFPTRDFRGPLTLFSKVKIPTLVIFGENDDYLVGDRVSAKETLDVFSSSHKSKSFQTLIIPRSDHGYRDCEDFLARALVRWVHSLR